ncbi:beta-class carbonic anhydrase [Streptococcus sobrinus]|uniref:beta-class carbonic anhydrase n=1 Tax=Streptococcus sobrinus TaxID=1310 RepID=UPI00031A1E4D|nr:carbonic anhydrase [Streptococcus sobrinus]
MTYFENFIKANQAYVDLHGRAHLPIKPKTRVAIITCMDSRLHVAPALGLALGDAHILRNAGGRVTDDVIRSLVISQQQLGTREVVVLHHTDCGAQTFKNADFVADLEERFQVDLQDRDFLPFENVEESVRQDVALLKASPLIPKDIAIFGAVYDVDTGWISPVQ